MEAKIYREDDLERQIELLKREAERPGTALSHTSGTQRNDFYMGNQSHSRAPSAASNHTTVSAQICPLCAGDDHEMDACPLFSNEEVDDSPDQSPSVARGESLARRKSGLSMEHVWCDNCDVSTEARIGCLVVVLTFRCYVCPSDQGSSDCRLSDGRRCLLERRISWDTRTLSAME